ncbi:DEAD/DEAH box helicase [Paenibacillus albiflavus]|uniref:DEAD/DEAH box helicase n=1 Tax=Paenibacillus albiflavus TaxID=2545760 RepID=A0A4R4E8Z7_9BACL|nr:DEAD/DEAH box helicase [Paenibacillus albiflavus]TCZ76294.1 DEAD/DEAH box helicase [Paenibacillus albiflavus]
MSQYTESITVHIRLSSLGDALIYGTTPTLGYVPGLKLKQRLFAWHEASFYGTELVVQTSQDIDLVVLPSEQVIPFFAACKLLQHIEWNWSEEAAQLLQLAPTLMANLEERNYLPSYSAYRAHTLAWTWDHSQEQELVEIFEPESDELIGLKAAFSDLVKQQYYATDTSIADLQREYPLLFADNHTATAGLDEQGWLMAIGWKADLAPFRPLLQLVEPDDHIPAWQIKLLLQDKLDQTILIPIRLAEDGQAFGTWPSTWSQHVHERANSWLEHLRTSLPAELLSGDKENVLNADLSDQAVWQFLTIDSLHLLEAGWQVLLPAWWEAASRKKPRVRAQVRSEVGSSKGKSLFGLDSIVDFDWRISIGEMDLSEAEFRELVARNERLVHFRGQWIPLDPVLLGQIRKAMAGVDNMEGLSFQDVLQLHLLGNGESSGGASPAVQEENANQIQLEVELNSHLIQLMRQITQQKEWPQLDVPAELKAELRSYQRDGFAWLTFLRRFGLGACLADDMGLGKTIQYISYLMHIKEAAEESGTNFPSLLICPTSVLGNWQKELSRFAPSLKIMLHYGSKRMNDEAFYEEVIQADIVLTSYATATLDEELLKRYTWTSICLDEAQNIKNAQTKQSSAVRSFPANHRIALTGTPIENRLSELWSIYDFINPGYLGTMRGFNARFANAIEKEHNEERTQDLQKLVKPFMLRRKKKDPAIQLDLPDKNEMKTYVHLTAEQGTLYDQTVTELMQRMAKLEGIERKGAILAALTQLKQLCDHPLLLTKESFSEVTSDATAHPDRDMTVLINRSSKLERLLDMIKEIREENERCLIFTQYIGMGEILQRVLQQELQEPILYLNGSTSKTARDRMIEQFQSQTLPPAEQPNVFILSIKAGGVGLNLTAANHVFHYDRWWNPAVENQATDRAYRMGQTKDVQVHKFISIGTLEERIDEMLEAKQQLSDNVITSSEAWITELSNDALKDLFTLRRDWNG